MASWDPRPSTDNYIYNLQYTVPNPPEMLGMSNGIRELWIPAPPTWRNWQMRSLSHKAAWDIPANIYLYATGKVNSREKYQNLVVRPGNAEATRTINLARVSYAGNWNPEPGAWPRMAKLAQAQFHTDLRISNVNITDLDAKATPIARHDRHRPISLSSENVDATQVSGSRRHPAGGCRCDGSDTFNSSFERTPGAAFPQRSTAGPAARPSSHHRHHARRCRRQQRGLPEIPSKNADRRRLSALSTMAAGSFWIPRWI